MAAPVVESVTSGANGVGTSVAITAPTGISVGDLLVIFVNHDTENESYTWPSVGWTQIFTGGFRAEFAAAYKIADSSDASAGSFTVSWSTNDTYSASMLRVSGVDGTTPIAQASVDYEGTDGSNQYIYSRTTTEDDCLVIGAFGGDDAGDIATPTGCTLEASYTGDEPHHIFSFVQSTAGATGNKIPASETYFEFVAAGFAIYPSSGGAAGVTLTASTGSFTLTGNAAGLEAGRKLTAEAQSYTLTGQDATLKQGFALLAEQGTITYTGNAAGLTAGRKLAADQQTYTLTGIDAGLTYTPAGAYDLIADAASYTLTGQATGLLAGRTLAAEAAAYTLTGVDAGLTYTPTGAYNLTADAATFALTGVAVDLVAARKLVAAAETYTLTGIAVGLSSGYGMSAGIGSYALTGVEVAFGRTYQVAAGVGTYSLTGIDAGLDYSGQSAWTEIPAASTTWTPISEASTTWTEI